MSTKTRSAAIDAILVEEKRSARATREMIVLGTPGSGKATFMRHVKALRGGYNDEEQQQFKKLIHQRVIEVWRHVDSTECFGGLRTYSLSCPRQSLATKHKWLPVFADVPVVIFVLNLDDCDCPERIRDALDLYNYICGSGWFVGSHICFFVNYSASLPAKLAAAPLTDVYPDGSGGSDSDLLRVAKGISSRFRTAHPGGWRGWYHRLMDVMDPVLVRVSIHSVIVAEHPNYYDSSDGRSSVERRSAPLFVLIVGLAEHAPFGSISHGGHYGRVVAWTCPRHPASLRSVNGRMPLAALMKWTRAQGRTIG
ncbi:hypothetical protein FB451DRAFT_1189564 [Mycena latifolia]|nr:hypothetical protein FB451DRAFT_1189564 [Mycena latifolia]